MAGLQAGAGPRVVQVLGPDGKPLGPRLGNASSGATGGLSGRRHLFSLALACPRHGHSMDELQPATSPSTPPTAAPTASASAAATVDPSLVVPDPSLTLNEGFAPFRLATTTPGAARRGPACGHRRRHPVGGHAEEGPEGALHGLATRRCALTTSPWTGRDTTGTSSGRAYRRGDSAYTEAQSDAQREKLSGPIFATVPAKTLGGKRLAGGPGRHGERQVHPRLEMSAAESLAFFEGAALHGPGRRYRPAHREGDPASGCASSWTWA